MKIEDYLPGYIDKKNDLPAAFDVSNHSTSLEPFIMMNTTDIIVARPVAKESLSRVPIVGYFLKNIETLFISRDSKETRG